MSAFLLRLVAALSSASLLVPQVSEARASVCTTGQTVAKNRTVRVVRTPDEGLYALYACTPDRRNARFIAYDDTPDDAIGDSNGIGSIRLAGSFIAGVQTVSGARGSVFAQYVVLFRVRSRQVQAQTVSRGPSATCVSAVRVRSDGLVAWLRSTGGDGTWLETTRWSRSRITQLDNARIFPSSLVLTRQEVRWTADGRPRSAPAPFKTQTSP